MVTDTMILPEIANHLRQDRERLERKVNHILDSFASQVKKSRVFPISKKVEWTSPARNTWAIFLYAEKRSDWDKLRYLPVCFFMNKGGKCGYTYVEDDKRKSIDILYLPHFFQRYKERTGCKGSPYDDFFMHFFDVIIDNCPSERWQKKGDKTIVGRIDGGIILGERMGRLQVFYTFVTDGLLKDGQKEYIDMLDENLQEHRENEEH